MHTKYRQLGLASVETVLLMPILLVLILMSVHIAKMMKTKLEVVDEARYAVWASGMGLTAGLSIPRVSAAGSPIVSTVDELVPENQADFLGDLQARARREYGRVAQLMGVLRIQGNGSTVSDSYSVYQAHPSLARWQFLIQDRNAVVLNRIWEAKEMPTGYDNYLNARLRSRLVFRDYFPCAGQASSPGTSRC